MINYNLEKFDKGFLCDGKARLKRLPVREVNLVIPPDCINYVKGEVDLEKLAVYLQNKNDSKDVIIKYEV